MTRRRWLVPNARCRLLPSIAIRLLLPLLLQLLGSGRLPMMPELGPKSSNASLTSAHGQALLKGQDPCLAPSHAVRRLLRLRLRLRLLRTAFRLATLAAGNVGARTVISTLGLSFLLLLGPGLLGEAAAPLLARPEQRESPGAHCTLARGTAPGRR